MIRAGARRCGRARVRIYNVYIRARDYTTMGGALSSDFTKKK